MSVRAATKTRTLIRSAAGYQSFFGHAPPPAVDFARDWVMFYAAGTEPTGGYDASFVAVLRAGSSLIAITQLVSPGPACAVTQVLTAPYALIKFPAQPGTSAQFYKSDTSATAAPTFCAATQCAPGMTCDADHRQVHVWPGLRNLLRVRQRQDANGCPPARATRRPPIPARR